jgi:hypothetical protein
MFPKRCVLYLFLEFGTTDKVQKNACSGMLRRMALVRTDVSEELSASIIRATRIGELGTLELATEAACVGC